MNAICLTHAVDADGLICGAYLKILRNASTVLVTYDTFIEALKKIDLKYKEVYICDLGINNRVFEEIQRLTLFSKVNYIDHHPLEKEVLKKINELNINIVHNKSDCAGVLLYNYFKDELDVRSRRLAAYAAISDQFENGPLASNLMLNMDKQFVYHEALILTHAIYYDSRLKFRLFVIDELSKLKYPHEIKGILEASSKYLVKTAKLLKIIPQKAHITGKLGYIEGVEDVKNGSLATLLIDSLNVDVGLCYTISKKGAVSLSLRARRGTDIDLGEITNRLAKKNDGFGGGHKGASGGSIPKNKYPQFFQDLRKELEKKEIQ